MVTVTLGDDKAPATTTVKSELRRLMLENVPTKPAKPSPAASSSTCARRRSPRSRRGAGEVKLKVPRETVEEAWNWDRA
jgi:hypothetical protein